MTRILRSASTGLMVGALMLLASCEEAAHAPRATVPEHLRPHVLSSAPAGIRSLDIAYRDRITLLGYSLEPAKPAPGEQVTVTLYWRYDRPLADPGWNLFTHLDDGAGRMLRNLDGVGPLRQQGTEGSGQVLRPSLWTPGEVYRDRQSFALPRSSSTGRVRLLTGIWKGDRRQPITRGASDGTDRGIVFEIPLGKPATLPPVPALSVPRLPAGSKLVIDGKLDEPAWSQAADTGAFVDVSTGKPNPGFPVQGRARLLWDSEHLYLGFEVQDRDLRGGFPPTARDPHLWTRDCVEIMIDPDGDGDNTDYYEIQINPQNLVFDTRFDGYNRPASPPHGPFGHQDWRAGLTSAVQRDGSLDEPGDRDRGYTVEVRIPWASFARAAHRPPRPGDTWRLNLYAMQNNSGVAWSPILGQGNFHRASRFGRVTWLER